MDMVIPRRGPTMGLAGGHRDWLILGAVLATSAVFLFVDAPAALRSEPGFTASMK